MTQTRARSVALVLGMITVALVVAFSSRPLQGQNETAEAQAGLEETAGTVATVANCRYGTTPTADWHIPAISESGAGWYLNFGFAEGPQKPSNGAEFVHMVRIREDATKVVFGEDECNCADDYVFHGTYEVRNPAGGLDQTFANYLKTNPGRKHIVGNEVDRFGAQDGSHAEVYADAYYEIYHFIKSHDPTAQVGVSGLVQFTPHRRAYLDAVWDAYIERHGTYMPVDFWTMHIYILPELNADGTPSNTWASVALGIDPANGKRHSGDDAGTCSDPDVYCVAEHNDLEIFKQQLKAMRQWMKDHGQRDKPLLLTEYSLLYPTITSAFDWCLADEFGSCFTHEDARDYLQQTFAYLNTATDPLIGYPLDDNRLVQQWMWFSVYNQDLGNVSNLLNPDQTTKTVVGTAFKDHVMAEARYRNLIVDRVANVDVSLNGAATTSARLSVTFRNKGNEAINQPFRVSFYKDAGRNVLIGSTVINPVVYGCASHAYSASVTWNGLTKGIYNYYAVVDSDDVIVEGGSGNIDNMGKGTVTVNSNQVSLPLVRSAN
jgi:hypothetical protein